MDNRAKRATDTILLAQNMNNANLDTDDPFWHADPKGNTCLLFKQAVTMVTAFFDFLEQHDRARSRDHRVQH